LCLRQVLIVAFHLSHLACLPIQCGISRGSLKLLSYADSSVIFINSHVLCRCQIQVAREMSNVLSHLLMVTVAVYNLMNCENLALTMALLIILFVCLLLNGTSALFRPLVPRIVEIEHTNHVKNDLK